MKQSNRTTQAQTNSLGKTVLRSGSYRSRHQINRCLRRFLILILLILMAAILLTGYASLFPVTFKWDTSVLNYQRDSSINYEVLLKSNQFTEQTALGMDQQYLRDFVEAVNADFTYEFHSDQASDFQYSYQIDAYVRVHNAKDTSQILLNRKVNLLPETNGTTSSSTLRLKESVSLNLAEYENYIANYTSQSSQPAVFDLMVTMSIKITAVQPGEPIVITAEPKLLIPLAQPQFHITRILPDTSKLNVIQPVLYKLILTPLPFAIYPAIAGVCLFLILLLLTLTTSNKKDLFQKRLNRMIRHGRSRLMLISDKAWEPEFCVTVSDYKSLIRTAKKLKHPVFCYVDQKSFFPAAYFYIYYGENNYCYTFTDESIPIESHDRHDSSNGDYTDHSGSGSPPADDDRIPLLPETDDNTEILMSNLKNRNSFSHY